MSAKYTRPTIPKAPNRQISWEDSGARLKVHKLLLNFCRRNPPSIIQGQGRKSEDPPNSLHGVIGINRYLHKIQVIKQTLFGLRKEERLNDTMHRLLRHVDQLILYSHDYKSDYHTLKARLDKMLDVRLNPNETVTCTYCNKILKRRFLSMHIHGHERDATTEKAGTCEIREAVESGEEGFFNPGGEELLEPTISGLEQESFEEVSPSIGYHEIASSKDEWSKLRV